MLRNKAQEGRCIVSLLQFVIKFILCAIYNTTAHFRCSTSFVILNFIKMLDFTTTICHDDTDTFSASDK